MQKEKVLLNATRVLLFFLVREYVIILKWKILLKPIFFSSLPAWRLPSLLLV